MRCGDCKHFKKLEEDGAWSGEPLPGLGHCNRWLTGYHIKAHEIPLNGCLVEDDEEWGNVVGQEFGCVLFEGKGKAA